MKKVLLVFILFAVFVQPLDTHAATTITDRAGWEPVEYKRNQYTVPMDDGYAYMFCARPGEYFYVNDNTNDRVIDPECMINVVPGQTYKFFQGSHMESFADIYRKPLNTPPVLIVNQNNIRIRGNQTITLSGTIQDSDNDSVTISAAVAGKTKQVTVTNTSSAKTWTLTWSGNEIPEGTYSNIQVTASDGK